MRLTNKFILGFLIFFSLLIVSGKALANDELKTIQYYIYDQESAMTGSVNQNFSIYIGDNISGVTDPVQSAFFRVSGIYTGAGSLNLSLNGDNLKNYNLPSVGVPTYFEFAYKDDAAIINPATAGTYTYTLGMNPSGVTIYGIGADLNLTYQYTPGSCPEGIGDKIKNIVQYIYDQESAMTGSVNQNFSIYIGDNISGVTDPVQSAFFRVSGIYTGAGSLNLSLNGDNLKNYNLPSVGVPTYFEFAYKDDAAIINPATAGTYTYTLGMNPSGVTIYGIGADLNLTYQYTPVCSGTLPATGELTSLVFDTTGTDLIKPIYNSFLWKGSLAGGTGRVRFQLATSNDPNGPWNFYGSPDNGLTCHSGAWYDPGDPETAIEIACASLYHNDQRYFRYKVQLCSDSDCNSAGAISPQVEDIIVNWSP